MAEQRSPEQSRVPSRPEWTSARLAAWRREIDAVDGELLELLQRRGELVLRIAGLKRQAGLAAHDPAREEVILAGLAAPGDGPFGPEAIVRIFRAVLDASLQLHAAEPADSGEPGSAVAAAGAATPQGGLE